MAAAVLAACPGGGGPKGPPPGAPVTVAAAELQTVPIHVDAIGTVEAYSSVQVRPLVSGTLNAVRFREGQAVRVGDPLFDIDPRPFRAAVMQALATVGKRISDVADARVAAPEGGLTVVVQARKPG